jgi:hypothetical protein
MQLEYDALIANKTRTLVP